MGSGFTNSARSKRSIVLDMKRSEGREIFMRLAAEADVVVQNFRPGAVERLGVGYEDIKKINPDIVYLSSCGFGHEGPYHTQRTYDPKIQCLSGMSDVQGDENGPNFIRNILPDKGSAMHSCQ